MSCGAPGTFHAFLLLVSVLPSTVQNTFQDDSDSGHLRTKRGVAKGNQIRTFLTGTARLGGGG